MFKDTIEEFAKLDLHDQEIRRLEFDFNKNEIRIFFSVFEEKVSGSVVFGYEFSDVHSLNISQMDLKKFLDLEIYSHEVIVRPNGDFGFRLEALQGVGEASTVISFAFKHHRKL